LKRLNIECVKPVINATVKDNLLPHRIAEHRENLTNKGAEKIFTCEDYTEDEI
jgi:hypothetical protein